MTPGGGFLRTLSNPPLSPVVFVGFFNVDRYLIAVEIGIYVVQGGKDKNIFLRCSRAIYIARNKIGFIKYVRMYKDILFLVVFSTKM